MISTNLKDHAVFDKLNQLKQGLSEVDTIETVDIENLIYLKSATAYIEDRLKITIAELVNEQELNALVSEVDQCLQQINAFLGNKNVGHLKNARANLTAASNRIRNFPLTLSKGDFNFLKQIANFQETITQKYKAIEEEGKKGSTQIKELEGEIAKNKNELEKNIRLLQEKEVQIQNLISKFQIDYDNFKNSIQQNIQTDRNAFRAEIDTDKDNYKAEINGIKENIVADASVLLKGINDKLEEAKKIVNVIGNIGVTGNYSKIASEHKKSANTWRIIAMIFMAGLSGLLVWTIFDLSSEIYDWKVSIIRIVGAAILSYPATYAARESSKHRKLETINRTAELELASINPFIETLPEELKQSIKEKLVGKYFGNNRDESENEVETLSPSGFEKIIKAISALLTK